MKTKSILTLVVVCILNISCKKEKSRICELYSNDVEYTIGTVQSITSSAFKATYNYDYSVLGINFKGKMKAYGIGQGNERFIGKQFVVIYEIGNESNSDLNTNYLIESEQDFEDFKSEFSSGPPPPNFPNNCK
ncbi:MAG: hypothetical protein EA392_01550 [Cryomorphaceae bacterium]|nr:MAG: hypothetical protein EA392_01550 [Cryomorphaceae bacterium]